VPLSQPKVRKILDTICVAHDVEGNTGFFRRTTAETVFLEAAVGGKPSIVSERAAAARWFASPVRSRLSPECQFSIARRIVEPLGDSAGARVMGKRAGNAASPQYSWPAVARHDECSLRHNRENLSRYSTGGNRLSTFDFGQSHSAAEGDLPTQSAPGRSH
jgi:hypothetical protein